MSAIMREPPRLTVALTSVPNRVDITVKGTVEFEQIDRALMKLGLRYVIRCHLFGEDPPAGLANDTNLNIRFNPPQIRVTGDTPAVEFEFVAEGVLRSALDEDAGRDADELYAFVAVNSNIPTETQSFNSGIVALAAAA